MIMRQAARQVLGVFIRPRAAIKRHAGSLHRAVRVNAAKLDMSFDLGALLTNTFNSVITTEKF